MQKSTDLLRTGHCWLSAASARWDISRPKQLRFLSKPRYLRVLTGIQTDYGALRSTVHPHTHTDIIVGHFASGCCDRTSIIYVPTKRPAQAWWTKTLKSEFWAEASTYLAHLTDTWSHGAKPNKWVWIDWGYHISGHSTGKIRAQISHIR